MTTLADYQDKYRCVAMRREDGILEMRLHTDGGPLLWASGPHEELGYCFADVAADRDNRVVIFTGTGDAFINKREPRPAPTVPPKVWDKTYWEGKRLLMNLLDIEVPVISAVNGVATCHSELAILSDIVLAAEHAIFQDGVHMARSVVPADGVHIVWPMVIGANRGRYFLLTAQKLSARQAMDWGAVNEVLPRDALMPRAWELARELAKHPPPHATLHPRRPRAALQEGPPRRPRPRPRRPGGGGLLAGSVRTVL